MGQSRPLLFYFRYFHITISIIQIENSIDGVLGIQTGAAGWQAQTKPWSYGGHPIKLNVYVADGAQQKGPNAYGGKEPEDANGDCPTSKFLTFLFK